MHEQLGDGLRSLVCDCYVNDGANDLGGRAESRSKVRAVGMALGTDGLLLPPPPREPSKPQRWNVLADSNDDISDLLDHFGQADNWIDIYKNIEFAAVLAGGERKLLKLLGDTGKDAKPSSRYSRWVF